MNTMSKPGDPIRGNSSGESATALGLNGTESEICSILNLDPKEFAAQKAKRRLNLGLLGRAGAASGAGRVRSDE